ncbi:MAG: extracellular solute-binding protein [Desulfobacterales bacterium]|nr:extracellular solute-binding protein [Desulfobacterales bacterium]
MKQFHSKFSSLGAIILFLLIFTYFTGPDPVMGKSKPTTTAEIALYDGPDRQQILEEGAKKEKAFVWYTSMNKQWSSVVIKMFEKKYPFLKTNLYRASSEDVVQRYVAEVRGGRGGADALSLGSGEFQNLLDEKLLIPYYSPVGKEYPDNFKDVKNKFWITNRINAFAAAFNTRMLKESEIPKTYADFLDPKWKNKIAVEASDYDWFATLMQVWGEDRGKDYFQKLGGQNLHVRRGHSNLLNLLAAGEFPLVLTEYAYLTEAFKERGAPVEWYYLAPTVVRLEPTGFPKASNHPHAAMLFVDFLIGLEAQNYLGSHGEMAAHPKAKVVPPRLMQIENKVIFDPEVTLPHWNRYIDLYNQWLLKR